MARTRETPKAAAIALAVALVAAGLGTVRAEHAVVSDFATTGHTTFLNAGTTFDDCFAGITGAVMSRVVWFNGATLFSRMSSGEDTWIYALESLDGPGHPDEEPAGGDGRDDHVGVSPFDPTKETLYSTGNIWTFPDENDPGHEWEVREYYHLAGGIVDPGEGGIEGGSIKTPDIHTQQKKVYVYAVHTSENAITDMTIHRDYNFVLIINTCQFLHRQGGHQENVTHDDGNNENPRQPAGQHDPNDVPPGGCQEGPEEDCKHDHNVFTVDIFIGGKPNAVPLPTDPASNSGESPDAPDGGGSS